MKPLLKWAGGKRKIAELLFSHFPSDWNAGTYYEPFIGGGAMYLHLQPQKSQISDLNQRLIAFYQHVKTAPELLLDGIRLVERDFNRAEDEEKKEFYIDLRSSFNNSAPDSIESAIGVFTLNKLCFNGLYRENAKGMYNVPFGQKKVFPEVNPNEFLEISSQFASTQIRHCSFVEAVQNAAPGDFVYFDPPYVPLEAAPSFTSYQAGGFGLEEQQLLATLLSDLAQKGVKALASNSSAILSYEIFKDHHLIEIQAPRMVSATSAGRGSVKELVIKNF
jgi:DNA adenine methylase